MKHLENIYLKHGITSNKANLLQQRSGVPRADSVTDECTQAFRRHSKHPVTGNQTTSKLANRKTAGPRLKKQNFVEDGQNIMKMQHHTPNLLRYQPQTRVNRSSLTGGFERPSGQSSMKFHKRELVGDNSASETDFHILNQLRTNVGDGTSQMEGAELIEVTPSRNARNATAEDSRP